MPETLEQVIRKLFLFCLLLLLRVAKADSRRDQRKQRRKEFKLSLLLGDFSVKECCAETKTMSSRGTNKFNYL